MKPTDYFDPTGINNRLEWTTPAPEVVKTTREAIAEYLSVRNGSDEARKHLPETKA